MTTRRCGNMWGKKVTTQGWRLSVDLPPFISGGSFFFYILYRSVLRSLSKVLILGQPEMWELSDSTLSLRLGKLVTKNILPVGVNLSLCIAERRGPVVMGTTTEIPLTYTVVGWQQNSFRQIKTHEPHDWIPWQEIHVLSCCGWTWPSGNIS